MLPGLQQQLAFKKDLCNFLPKQSCQSWFQSLKLIKITPTKVILGGIPHAIYRYEIKTNYEPVFIKVLETLYPEMGAFSERRFEYLVDSKQNKYKATQPEFDLEQDPSKKTIEKINEFPKQLTENISDPLKAQTYSGKDQLITSLQKDKIGETQQIEKKFNTATFGSEGQTLLESFIPGERNLLASRACRAVADMPGLAFNPFVIYGESGTGKTHLLQGIGNEISKNNADKNVIYISAEDFLNDFITKLRSQQMREFREHYRKADVFLIDDFQAMLVSSKCQSEYLYTINALRQKGAQIIVASQMPLNKLNQLMSELLGRLESGLSVDVGTPDVTTRLEILYKKATKSGIPINEELAHFLVNHIDGGIGRLEGALTRLGVHASLLNQELTIPLARKTLKDWINDNHVGDFNTTSKSPYVSEHLPGSTEAMIIQRVCSMYQVSLDRMKSYSRERCLVKARQATIYLLKELTQLSLNEIGNTLERNHSTIHASLKKAKTLMLKDVFFQKQMKSLMSDLTEEECIVEYQMRKQQLNI